MFRIYSLLWLVFVVAVVYDIWKQPLTQETKLLWSGVVVFFPGIGILAWLLYGRTRF